MNLPTIRGALVYLPPCYRAEPARSFPVLYLNDGQNVFDGATSFVPGMEWQVDETAERLIGLGAIEPLIIVAVENAGLERLNEYGPTVDLGHGAGGGSARYERLLIDELKPVVDGHFRTRTGPGDTGLGGSSMGGLVTLDIGLRRPDVFGRLAVMSPAVWWDRRVILQRVAAFHDAARRPRVWLDMGTAEGPHAVANARRLRRALLRQGWTIGDSLRYAEASRGAHDEAAWGARMEHVLRFLFPPRA